MEMEILLKVGLAGLLGGAVGAEREKSGKSAGLRTHMLLAIGAALLTDISVSMGARYSGGSQAWDPARITAQIVSGVGFLGAGTILQARGAVRGLTTAAGLWVAAAVGIAVGAAYYFEAGVTTVAVVIVLAALPPLERRMLSSAQEVVLLVETRHALAKLIQELDDSNAGCSLAGAEEKEGELVVTLRVEDDAAREKVMSMIAERDQVRTLEP